VPDPRERDAAPPEEPDPIVEVDAPPPPAAPARAKFVDVPTIVEAPVAQAAVIAAAASVRDPFAAAVAKAPDLGLEEVANEARNEQSGVYDRRALRKIGELERQLSQLKTELDRARAAADAAARGGNRERDFLNLREQIIAKDKALHQAKDELAARDHE